VEIAAIIISILALLVAIVTPIFEKICDKNINDQSLEAEYFRELYGNILYQESPKALSMIHFDGQKVTGTDEMIEVLRSIRLQSVFFKFSNPDFYNELINTTQQIEDLIIQMPENMTDMDFNYKYQKIIELFSNLHSMISNKCLGRS